MNRFRLPYHLVVEEGIFGDIPECMKDVFPELRKDPTQGKSDREREAEPEKTGSNGKEGRGGIFRSEHGVEEHKRQHHLADDVFKSVDPFHAKPPAPAADHTKHEGNGDGEDQIDDLQKHLNTLLSGECEGPP